MASVRQGQKLPCVRQDRYRALPAGSRRDLLSQGVLLVLPQRIFKKGGEKNAVQQQLGKRREPALRPPGW